MFEDEVPVSVKLELSNPHSNVHHTYSFEPFASRNPMLDQVPQVAELGAERTQDDQLRLVSLHHLENLLGLGQIGEVPSTSSAAILVSNIQTPTVS